MLDDVGEPAIERNEYAVFACRHRSKSIVGSADELLIPSECYVVAGLAERRPNGVGNVLIELDRGHSYAAGIGTMVSRASSAA